MLGSSPETIAWLQRHTGGQPTRIENVQSLWSGYGAIVRVHLREATMPSVIVKSVEPPQDMQHPRGWSGQASHDRKLRSYEVETCFYSNWQTHASPTHRTAHCFAAEQTEQGWRFLLEDLDAAGFAKRYTQRLDEQQVTACLRWLASFHAAHLGCEPTGLWSVGTYWHLATRSDELDAMQDDELRAAAMPLDAALNACKHQTLLHGDAKVANFCFGEHDVAAVDFQYVGGGCGIKDVAYFLSSCLSDAECERHAERHLDTYFAQLREHVDASVDADALVAEWRALYPAAWADFHRFLVGWAPDHWKIHRYTKQMTRMALKSQGI